MLPKTGFWDSRACDERKHVIPGRRRATSQKNTSGREPVSSQRQLQTKPEQQRKEKSPRFFVIRRKVNGASRACGDLSGPRGSSQQTIRGVPALLRTYAVMRKLKAVSVPTGLRHTRKLGRPVDPQTHLEEEREGADGIMRRQDEADAGKCLGQLGDMHQAPAAAPTGVEMDPATSVTVVQNTDDAEYRLVHVHDPLNL